MLLILIMTVMIIAMIAPRSPPEGGGAEVHAVAYVNCYGNYYYYYYYRY